MNEINKTNWNFCQYKNDNLKAIISFGASPDILDDSFNYYVTVLDDENNEVFQEEFQTVDAACQSINHKYSDVWEFSDLSQKNNSGGCDSCSAH